MVSKRENVSVPLVFFLFISLAMASRIWSSVGIAYDVIEVTAIDPLNL